MKKLIFLLLLFSSCNNIQKICGSYKGVNLCIEPKKTTILKTKKK